MTDTHSQDQAQAQLASIIEMVAALKDGGDEARDAITEDALSVQIRTTWFTPGHQEQAEYEFEILLCTGGPACRIVGDLNKWKEPENVRLEHQDWGTPWAAMPLDDDQEAAVLAYAQQFYFGE